MAIARCPKCWKVGEIAPDAIGQRLTCQCGHEFEPDSNDCDGEVPTEKGLVERVSNANPVLLVGASVAFALCMVLLIIAAVHVGKEVTVTVTLVIIVVGCLVLVGSMNQRRDARKRADRLQSELYCQEMMLYRQQKMQRMEREIADRIRTQFMVEACSRCKEFTMSLVNISPNGRSVEYECDNCGKKSFASAITPAAHEIVKLWAKFRSALVVHHGLDDQVLHVDLLDELTPPIVFDVQKSPLPYEQTLREPIPPAVQSEVYRRDNGKCVRCGSLQQLEFDHIIPVSKGGATTAGNLQLLCRACNLAKGAKI